MTGGEIQVIIRQIERCERCGAANPFRKRRSMRDDDGQRFWYAKCRRCGAPAKVYWLEMTEIHANDGICMSVDK